MREHHLQDDPVQTHLLAFESGESITDGLEAFAQRQQITSARLAAGIGAVSRATLSFFDLETNSYEEIPVEEQTEVLSLHGSIARFEGGPKLHIHAVLGRRDGSCVGGHLVDATVDPTIEVFVTAYPHTLTRHVDEATTLPLLTS